MQRSPKLRHAPPTCFVPSCPADFVGQAGKVAEALLRKAERLKANPNQSLKLLISGAPGIGKTSLVNLIARPLTSHPAAIEEVSGWLGFASRRRFVDKTVSLPQC